MIVKIVILSAVIFVLDLGCAIGVITPTIYFDCGQRFTLVPRLFSTNPSFPAIDLPPVPSRPEITPPAKIERIPSAEIERIPSAKIERIPSAKIERIPSARAGRSIVSAANTYEEPIVGGSDALHMSWPWMASLGRLKNETNDFFCGATIINHQYLLTAAHCVLGLEPFFARLGENDLTNIGLGLIHDDVFIANVTFHPEYKLDSGYEDIALLELKKPIRFRDEIQPLCLPWSGFQNETFVNRSVTITGWGAKQYGGARARKLQEAKITVYESSLCHSIYSELQNFAQLYADGLNSENIICAGDISGGKDTCQGDSGGPLVLRGANQIFSLIGIVSKGFGCGKKEFPGLYTPVAKETTLQWIKEVAFN